MNKLLFYLAIILFSVQAYSQINFEKAYFIDKNDVRTDCFIRNNDLYKSPKSFIYKLNEEDSNFITANIDNVKEFVINNKIKYVKCLVKIDMSTANLNKLSESSEPEWEEKTLFLRVLIEGGATLFEYKDEFVRRYFYKLNDAPIEQLIYKKFFVKNSSETNSAVNNDFQKQLWINMNCGNETTKKVMKLEYNTSNLSKYFEEYNNCRNYNYTNYIGKATTGSINFKLKGGINLSTLENSDTKRAKTEYFGDKLFPRFGAEFEYVTPFNRNKWSVYVELTYQIHNYKFVETVHSPSGSSFETVRESDVSDNGVLPIVGFRHYMFLNDNSSIFLGLGLFKTYSLGYNYKQKFNLEFQTSSTAKFSVVLGYTLFNNKKHR